MSEIEGWYGTDVMKEDDRLMFNAEVKGIKRRAYEEWLTKEADRVDDARRQMLTEDVVGARMRVYWAEREYALQIFEEPAPGKRHFALATETPLPGAYDYITEEVPVFTHGTGLDNEDEIEEFLEEQRREAELVSRRDEIEALKVPSPSFFSSLKIDTCVHLTSPICVPCSPLTTDGGSARQGGGRGGGATAQGASEPFLPPSEKPPPVFTLRSVSPASLRLPGGTRPPPGRGRRPAQAPARAPPRGPNAAQASRGRSRRPRRRGGRGARGLGGLGGRKGPAEGASEAAGRAAAAGAGTGAEAHIQPRGRQVRREQRAGSR